MRSPSIALLPGTARALGTKALRRSGFLSLHGPVRIEFGLAGVAKPLLCGDNNGTRANSTSSNNSGFPGSHGNGKFMVEQEGGDANVFVKKYGIEPTSTLPVLSALQLKSALAQSQPERLTSLFQSMADHLLPKNYKTSVGPTYTTYVKWGMLSSTIGTVSGVLSMQTLLYAVGMGQSAIVGAAAINWVLKDGLGQLGGVLFASFLNQRFDAEPRRWRFMSALVLDLSILLEVLTPLFPGYFLPIASVANIGKNIGWLSASATRAGLFRSFMREENLADITGKAGSQTIAASVVGTGLGVGVSAVVGQSISAIFASVSVLSLMHLFCVYQSLGAASVATLNVQRFWLAARPALDMRLGDQSDPRVELRMGAVLAPDAVSAEERFLHFGALGLRSFGDTFLPQHEGGISKSVGLRIGAPVDKVFSSQEALFQAKTKMDAFGQKHILHVKRTQSSPLNAPVQVNLLFAIDSTPQDQLRAILHAAVCYHFLLEFVSRHGSGDEHAETIEQLIPGRTNSALPTSLADKLISELSAKEWDVEHLFFESDRSRIRFAF
jgi:hypothetical protein